MREISNYNPGEIFNLLTEDYVLKILMITKKKPKSVKDLISTLGIPIAVCYRKIYKLEKLGFLKCVGKKLNCRGKWFKLYQSQIVNAQFFLEKGKFSARVQLSSGVIDDFGGSWSISDLIHNKEFNKENIGI